MVRGYVVCGRKEWSCACAASLFPAKSGSSLRRRRMAGLGPEAVRPLLAVLGDKRTPRRSSLGSACGPKWNPVTYTKWFAAFAWRCALPLRPFAPSAIATRLVQPQPRPHPPCQHRAKGLGQQCKVSEGAGEGQRHLPRSSPPGRSPQTMPRPTRTML